MSQFKTFLLSNKQRRFISKALHDSEFSDTLTVQYIRLIETIYNQGYYLVGQEQAALQDFRKLWIEYASNKPTPVYDSFQDKVLAHLKKRYKEFTKK